MNYNDIVVIDFETSGKCKFTSQPIEVGMVAINGRKLEIIPGSEFVSLMKPFDDEEAIKLGLEPVQDEALTINHKTREELAKAPHPKVVWARATEHINRYNYKKNMWSAPIMAGYNSDNFDSQFIHRLCCCDPYKYGPKDDSGKQNKLFHPIHTLDAMKMVWQWTENNIDIKSLSLDNIRDWMGMSKDGAHEALTDVKQTAELLIKFLKLHRNYAPKIKFANAFGGNKVVESEV